MANMFRCDECGRFISYFDLYRGPATIKLVTPDSAYTSETYETLCIRHSFPVAHAPVETHGLPHDPTKGAHHD